MPATRTPSSVSFEYDFELDVGSDVGCNVGSEDGPQGNGSYELYTILAGSRAGLAGGRAIRLSGWVRECRVSE